MDDDGDPNSWDSGDDAQAKGVVDCNIKKEVTGEDGVPAGDLTGGGFGGVGRDIREPRRGALGQQSCGW